MVAVSDAGIAAALLLAEIVRGLYNDTLHWGSILRTLAA